MPLGIFIPLHERQPLALQHYNELEDYQEAVAGSIEGIDVGWERMSFFANTDAKLIGMGINRRATLLWWLHTEAARNHDFIAGDVVLVGPAHPSGATLSVPMAIQQLLFTPPSLTLEVSVAGSPKWHRHEQHFDDYFETAMAGLTLLERSEVEDIRVLPTSL
jgi:hypothetical protein